MSLICLLCVNCVLLVVLILLPFIFTNPVFPTLPRKIPCVFPVKVTYKTSKKKSAKAKTKKLTYTLTVAKASVALSGESVVAVGDTTTLTTTKKASKRATITYTSSDDSIATVSEDGTVKGVKAGKATITATLKIGKDTATATQDVEVKNVILKSVAQKKASQIVATFAGDTSKLDKKDITITNTANNVVYPVKAISVAADKKTVKIDTYSEMNDAKEYSVKYDGTEVTFTATDGTVADVGVSTTTIVKGTAGTEVKAQFLDKNQVVVKEFTLFDASNDGSVDFNFTENKGYTDGNKLVLLNVGDTATAEVTYHTNKYDQTTGAETGKITKKFTITAVEDDATLSNFNYTINAKNTQVNWNIDVKTDNKLAVKDTAYAFFYIKNSSDADVTSQYSVESSDKSVLLLDKTSLTSAGDAKGSTGVAVTGVKAGTAYINVLNSDGKVVKSLPVIVQETRKLTNLKFDAMTVNNNATGSSRQLLTSDSETIKAYDQYESQISISTVDNEVLSAPSAETNHKKGTTNFPVTYTTTGSMITVNASGLAEGSYQVKLTAHTTDGKCDTNATVSRVLTVNVVNVTDTPSTASYRLSVSDQKADLAIASDAVAADFANKAISTSVSEYQKGAKVSVVSNAAITIKNPDGKVVGQNGSMSLYSLNSTVNAYELATDIKAGTYSVSATATIGGVDKKFNTTFVLDNTQTKAIAKIDTKVASSQRATRDAAADAVALLTELNNSDKFSYTYDGIKQNFSIVSADAKENGKALYITSVKVVVVNDAGASIVVECPINTAFTLK
ncbi:MAG: hypothetical protein EGS40_00455 [Agathobacter sp.]|nr:hypothetical protein [Agathobacter sp.]